MTVNQLMYLEYEEKKRSNLMNEEHARNVLAENVRHNIAGESLGRDTLNENVRHNMQNEFIALQSNSIQAAAQAESARHNAAVEAETQRSNLENEKIKADSLAEQARHNLQNETLTATSILESSRHNVATEAAASEANKIAMMNAQTQATKVAADAIVNQARIRNDALALEMKAIDQRLAIEQYDHKKRMDALDWALKFTRNTSDIQKNMLDSFGSILKGIGEIIPF